MVTLLLKREGIRGFYKGTIPSIMRNAPSSGLYFWFYDFLKGFIEPQA